MAAPPKPGVSVVLPVRSANPSALAGWLAYLPACGRPWQLIAVADGVPLDDHPQAIVLRHDAPRGYGACVRTALPAITHPLVLLAADDYPYTPADLGQLLDRIDTPGEMPDPATGEWGMRTPDLVAGCRTGVPEPAALRVGGAVLRAFCRVALGLHLEKRPGWYGAGEYRRGWLAWLVFGVPLNDPHAGFKLVRKELLERFPIQCDGDLFHVELVGKATFLTCMMDELPLTPKPDRAGGAVWKRDEFNLLFGKPQFAHLPVEPRPQEAGATDGTDPEPAGAGGSPEGATGNSQG